MRELGPSPPRPSAGRWCSPRWPWPWSWTGRTSRIRAPTHCRRSRTLLVRRGRWGRRGHDLPRTAAPAAVSAADRTGLRFGVVALFAARGRRSRRDGAVDPQLGSAGALFAGGYDFGYLGLGTLSVLYLPQPRHRRGRGLVGANAQVGTASVDLMTVTGGDVLPALAALPADGLGTIGAVGFAVPAVIALFVAVRCRSDPIRSRPLPRGLCRRCGRRRADDSPRRTGRWPGR